MRKRKVLSILALLLLISTGAQAKLAKVTFSGNNKSKTVYVGLPHAFWSNRTADSSNRYELDYIIAELWNKSAGYSYGTWTTEGSDKVTCSSSSTPQYSVRIITISDVFDGEATVSGKYMTSSGQLDITLTITAEAVDNSGWATDITAGQYYIVDATTNKMMAAGHDWGTRAIVSDQGLDLTLTPDASSKTVTIDSRVSNGGDSHFLNILNDNELYMDSNAFDWAFVTNGTGYSIYDYTSGKYISIDANDNLVLIATPRQFNLVSKDDMLAQLKAKMATATATNPVDATMLITAPNFNRNDARNEAWEVVESTPWNYNPSGGNSVNNCAESYMSKFTVRQTISGVPAGRYQLTAQGFYTGDGDAPCFFANGVNKNVPVIAGSEDSMDKASASFTQGLYTIDPIEFEVTEDGMMYIGITSPTSTHWVIWDNFRLTYLGDPNAAPTYKVTLAEGTEDADKWTVTPAEAATTGVAEGTKVTVKYGGEHRVKSVTAVVK